MAKKSTTPRRKKRQAKSGDPAKEPHSLEPSSLTVVARNQPNKPPRGTGTVSAGQSGALQGLPRDSVVDSESVEELVSEGQAHEADVVSSIEDAPEPDEGELHTHEPPD